MSCHVNSRTGGLYLDTVLLQQKESSNSVQYLQYPVQWGVTKTTEKGQVAIFARDFALMYQRPPQADISFSLQPSANQITFFPGNPLCVGSIFALLAYEKVQKDKNCH
jgi:hypothetical protein